MDNRTIEQIRENETKLIKELQQKENIIKEVREYIEQDVAYCKAINEPITKQQYILEMLEKEVN